MLDILDRNPEVSGIFKGVDSGLRGMKEKAPQFGKAVTGRSGRAMWSQFRALRSGFRVTRVTVWNYGWGRPVDVEGVLSVGGWGGQ